MMKLYTAVGRFVKKGRIGGLSCPVIFAGQKEYGVDLQEMMLWTILNRRILEADEIGDLYRAKAMEVGYDTRRSWEDCLSRLHQRGLVVSGAGETGEDALYNLLSCLYVIPISNSILLRVLTFLKLTLVSGKSVSAAKRVFERHPMTGCEKQVYELSRQALLSTAEIIKCVDKKATSLTTSEKILEILYDDEVTTSDNIASLVRCLDSRQPVILAVANLYLAQQIIFERGDVA